LAIRLAMRPEYAGNFYYRTYHTADSYIAVGCLGPEPRRRLQEALGLDDPRYAPGWSGDPEETRRVGEALVRRAEELFASKTTREWIDYLTARGIPCGPVRFPEELFEDEQVRENEMLIEMEHSLVGTIVQPAPSVRISATPPQVQLPPPALGEHTDEVLRRAGLDDEAIARLHEQGVVR